MKPHAINDGLDALDAHPLIARALAASRSASAGCSSARVSPRASGARSSARCAAGEPPSPWPAVSRARRN